jgi:hypothetical protein
LSFDRIAESDQIIILKPMQGDSNLQRKGGLLVFSDTPPGDPAKELEKHREDRAKNLRRENENFICLF